MKLKKIGILMMKGLSLPQKKEIAKQFDVHIATLYGWIKNNHPDLCSDYVLSLLEVTSGESRTLFTEPV